MFKRFITINGKKYYRIVESFRVNGKVKQAYVGACGPEDIGIENAQNRLADDSLYVETLMSLKDNPKVKRLVRTLMPSGSYENRRKGQRDNCWEGRSKTRKCPVSGDAITLRVLKDSGKTICLDSTPYQCRKCEFYDGLKRGAKK